MRGEIRSRLFVAEDNTLTKCIRLAFERTLTQMEEVVELAGMRIKQVHATRSVLCSITVRQGLKIADTFLGAGHLSRKSCSNN